MCRCLEAQLSCCCGPEPCSLCCGFLPSIRESITTKFMYTLLLALATLTACLMQTPDLEHLINEHIPNFNETCVILMVGHNCEHLVGYLAVYRVCFTLVVFHTVLMILMLGVSTSKSWRATIHNGYWGIKFFVLVGMCIGSFFIPAVEKYSLVWMYTGLVGACIFIIIQLILLVDFAHTWHSKWYGRAISGNGARCCYYSALGLCSLLFIIMSAVGAFLLFLYYTKPDACLENKVFIGVNAGLCFFICFISVLPCMETCNKNIGILQASVVSLYVMFVTWTAVTSEPPKHKHDKLFPAKLGAPPSSTTTSAPPYGSVTGRDELIYCVPDYLIQSDSPWSQASGYVGVIIMFFLAVYQSLRTTARSPHLGINPNPPERGCWCCCCCGRMPMSDRGGQKVLHDDLEGVTYSYAFMHFIFCLASLYIMMQLTMWFKPEESNLERFGLNWPSVWVKMGSSWACILVYLLTIFCPTFIPGRDFALIRRTDDEPDECIDRRETSV